MEICTRCGKTYSDQHYCPYCGLGESSHYRFKGDTQGEGINHSGRIKENITLKQRPELSNGIKVFMTYIVGFVPLLGQLIGLILGIYYLYRANQDTISFGKALLVLSGIVFVGQLCLIIIISIVLLTTDLGLLI